MATDQLLARDAVIRQAAFDHVRALQSRDPVLSHDVIKEGFQFEGKRWPLVNPQRGIFKPGPMPFLLSIRTVFPKKGGRVWYDDQRNVRRQIFAGEEVLDYAFMGRDPAAPENT
jgi:putative restriction endonuclease